MSCHVMSWHLMSCHVIACSVRDSNHVISCWLSNLLSYLGKSWVYGGPLAHLGASVGPCWGLCWPLGPILGPCWGLCWPILGAMLAYFGPKSGSKQRATKNVPKMAQKRSRQWPKNGPFFVTSTTSVVDIPTFLKNAAETSIQNPFRAATSEKSRFLGSPWPLLGAMSARLGRPVGPSWRPRWRHFGPCCHKRQGGRLANHAPTISPAAGRAPTNAPTHGRLGNHSRRLSPVACRAHTNAAPHGWAPRKPLPGALPSGLSRPHHRSNARAKRKNAPKREFRVLQSPKTP